jgi:hypothetical protein
MAIAECLSSPETLLDALMYVRDSEYLNGILAVALGLGLWLVAQISVDAKRRYAPAIYKAH